MAEGYRSRAAYKLIELDERFGFLKGVRHVVDLGAAPGGWCQVVVNNHPKATIVAIDLLEMDALPNTTILKMDFLADERSEEHTSELQSLMRISYAVFCLKNKNVKTQQTHR